MRILAGITLALTCVAAHAELAYTVEVNPEQGNIKVSIVVEDAKSGVVLKSPNWAPGSYRLVDNYRSVNNFKATDSSGKELDVNQSANSWSVAGADRITVSYTITNAGSNGAWHWSGPSTYLYVDGRKEEACTLSVKSPGNWTAYTGLDEIKGKPNLFTAENYDVLADNPVSIGNVTVDTFRVRGKDHFIVYRNAGVDQIDREKVKQTCIFTAETQADFFGGLPFNKYVFHFALMDNVDGGGGLEHLTSTQITLPTGFGRWSQTVIPHEYYHLWNVKRIRSAVLGPFDYDKLPKTGALWWLEGVTDYYAHLLLHRYGYWGREEFYNDILSNFRTYGSAAGRLTTSIYDSSYRVGEAANGRGNSQGYQFSYYDAGWVAGMFLDLEIRARTNNKRSLDDVQLALWKMCKDNQAGFPEDEIRRQVLKYGGNDIADFYDNLIMKPGEKDFSGTLKKVGLRMVETGKVMGDPGFNAIPGESGLTVRSVSTVAQGKLERGDVILKIDGKEVGKTRRYQTEAIMVINSIEYGKALKLQVKRGDKTLDVELVTGYVRRQSWKVEEDPGATREQIALRDAWLFQKRIK